MLNQGLFEEPFKLVAMDFHEWIHIFSFNNIPYPMGSFDKKKKLKINCSMKNKILLSFC